MEPWVLCVLLLIMHLLLTRKKLFKLYLELPLISIVVVVGAVLVLGGSVVPPEIEP